MARLEADGFEITEEAFSFSAFPASAGPSVLGIFFAMVTLSAARLAATSSLIVALATAIGGLAFTVLAGRVLMRWGTPHFPAMRRQSTNVIARRDLTRAPNVWLVAHLDSKSQTIRMLVRVGSVVLAGLFFLLFIFSVGLQMSGVPIAEGDQRVMLAWQSAILAFLTAVAVLPIVFCFIGNHSRGALDNATGVAAVILAAESLPLEMNVGVLLTSGEELALAGARAFAESHRQIGVALNCDTIDDSGEFICMSSSRRNDSARKVAGAAATIGERVRPRGMIMGILADNVAFSDAGWDACTLSRGNLATLARVHTSRDIPELLDGTGIARAARILARAAEELA